MSKIIRWKKCSPKTMLKERSYIEGLVVVEERRHDDDPWERHIDYATNNGDYIDGWETLSDWYEGQQVRIQHYIPFEDISLPDGTVIPTPEEFTKQMWEAIDEEDEETTHMKQDELMHDLLCKLGYGDAMLVYDSTPKWHS